MWLAALLGVAVLAVLVVLRLTAGGLTVHDSGSGGPLDGGVASDTVSIWSIEIGQSVTMGHLVVSNTGSEPLVLDGLRLMPPLSDGLEYIGTVTAQDSDREAASIGAGRSYPPDAADIGQTRPLEGTVVPPEPNEGKPSRGTAILVGMRLTKPGAYGFDRMEVDYHVGKKRYTMRVDIGFVGCGPEAEYPERCPQVPAAGGPGAEE
ncbi:MAG: hypothetical protein ACRDZ3_20225 [Acidimicrobiia bacterium]